MSRPMKDIIKDAERALLKQEKLKAEARELERQIRLLCLEFGQADGSWAIAPHHLKREVETRTNRKIAA